MPKQPKKATRPKKEKPLYRQKTALNPRPPVRRSFSEGGSTLNPLPDIPHAKPLAESHFEIREDGAIIPSEGRAPRVPDPSPTSDLRPPSSAPTPQLTHADSARHPRPSDGRGAGGEGVPKLIYSSDSPFIRLYHGNCLELLDAIYARYGDEGRFDAIFADPPYFLSNGGITCHAGKMVKVDKGDWDKTRGPELNHEFNLEWLKRCQRVLKPNGTIWVSGTHHVIFSIGYALQQLGYKILNDIAWEKPNPPPNLSCRYFTHSTETILWAAKSRESRHTFNYKPMKAITGKQMKTVWTMSAPKNEEKALGKHPTQKPLALVERCILASTKENDFVLDPFLGSGTTAIACLRLNRNFIGIELDLAHLTLAQRRTDRQIIELWLNHFKVHIEITVVGGASVPASSAYHSSPATRHFSLDLFPDSINGSLAMSDKPEIQTERIFHETKFVFLSCAEVAHGSVVHTTVDISLQEAWAKTPTGKKRETTHIVRCETEIYRVRQSPTQ